MGYFSKLGILEMIGYGKLRNLMSPSVARGFLNLRLLWIRHCPLMEEVITKDEQGEESTSESFFPRLENLNLKFLPKPGPFFLMKHALEFPFLRRVEIYRCPEMSTFFLESVNTPSLESLQVETLIKDTEATDDIIRAIQQLSKSKVSCPSLKDIHFRSDNITSICRHQLPTGYFSKLDCLVVEWSTKLRNLMLPSTAKGFLNLRMLMIRYCPSMEEVIVEDELGGEMTYESLFPRLKYLEFNSLPKLGHFFLTERALDLPFLREVTIIDCPEMNFFSPGSVNTPSLKGLTVGSYRYVADEKYNEVKDNLNKMMQHIFNSKEQEASGGDLSEASQGEKSEVNDGRG